MNKIMHVDLGLRPPANIEYHTQECGSRSLARSGVASMTCTGTSTSQAAAAPINHHNTRLNVMDFSNLGANKTN